MAAHPQSGRYDLLFGFPGTRITGADGFDALDQAWRELRCEDHDDLPFLGGWFLLIGYEAAQALEPRLQLPASPSELPDFLAVRCTAAIICDRERGRIHLVAEQDPAQLDALRQAVAEASAAPAAAVPGASLLRDLVEDPPEQFIAGVERIHDYLRAGDCFQVNLSRAWHGRLGAGAGYEAVYRRLRLTNPAPFAGLARIGELDLSVLSSSPERLVQVIGDRVQTRPIAGTRPRGGGSDDAELQRQLIGSLKERAEHVMLIDLERNDLGRLCRPGSIEVSELMGLESYAHVHHIVSNVRGRLRAGVGPGEVLSAVFPGGTITGCPKVRAMEIIAELEGVGRGPYTGSMGYLSRCGRLDTNILIRSLLVQGDRVSLRAGAGIVADSVPGQELEETRAKARGMLLALGWPA